MEKIRPVVVLSSDIFTGLKLKVCVPITGWKNTFDSYEWFVKLTPNGINNLSKVSGVNGLQIRCLDVGRFFSKIGRVTASELEDILASVAIVLEIS